MYTYNGYCADGSAFDGDLAAVSRGAGGARGKGQLERTRVSGPGPTCTEAC